MIRQSRLRNIKGSYICVRFMTGEPDTAINDNPENIGPIEIPALLTVTCDTL